MKKFRVELNPTGDYTFTNGEFYTIDKFEEIEAETAQEAIGFAIDWVHEHGLLSDDPETEIPESYAWIAAEILTGDWGETYTENWEDWENDIEEPIIVDFQGGESRTGNTDCNYMLAVFTNQDGEEDELYSEILLTEFTENTEEGDFNLCEWDDYSYPLLKEDIIDQAKEKNIDIRRLRFPLWRR